MFLVIVQPLTIVILILKYIDFSYQDLYSNLVACMSWTVSHKKQHTDRLPRIFIVLFFREVLTMSEKLGFIACNSNGLRCSSKQIDCFYFIDHFKCSVKNIWPVIIINSVINMSCPRLYINQDFVTPNNQLFWIAVIY